MSLEQHDEVTVRHRNYREDKGGPMKVFVVPDHQPQKKHDNQDLDKLPPSTATALGLYAVKNFGSTKNNARSVVGTA